MRNRGSRRGGGVWGLSKRRPGTRVLRALGYGMKNSFKDNEYSVKIRVKPETLEWIKAHKGKKSAAGFLEELLDYIRNSNQFKKKK